ncbi:hypothetical protein GCM10007973_02770 [Polymorphobacter multimanifer]|uniref:Superinfection immunity protein n=1 Tax=Polymorphobacter multimanifer TaxID=1070431 RepID=A0A841L588_9SPHN|nr:superinfection immunity protein [Polymorphobacter multimanifer]MBB6226641.1 hypothetical protein [Polymorphobacter multimanifer]GGI69136.1 hypothetical protein GCM10007973_02770 [Polymorphobacter multimanifer]
MGTLDWTLIAWVTLGVLIFNFIPSVIAFARRHPDRRMLARLNILSLLSLLLWAALLVWAVGGKKNDSVISRFVHAERNKPLLIGLVVLLVAGGAAVGVAGITT